MIFTKRTNKRCSLLREKIYYEEGRLVLPGEKKPFWVARYNCNRGAIGTAYKAVRGEQEGNGGEEKLLATFDFATWSNRGDADFFLLFSTKPPSKFKFCAMKNRNRGQRYHLLATAVFNHSAETRFTALCAVLASLVQLFLSKRRKKPRTDPENLAIRSPNQLQPCSV